jgi:acyl-coenzyme A synthetase/AMP-(fatty) acid ligase
MNDIVGLILAKATLWPERIAMLRIDRAVSYGMLVKGVASVRRVLSEAGLDRARPVGMQLDDPVLHLIVAFALMAEGYCCVTFSGDLAKRAREFGIDTVIGDQGCVVVGVKTMHVDPAWFRGAGNVGAPCVEVSPDAIIKVEFTSGSTGKSKPVALTRQALYAQTLSRVLAYSLEATRSLCTFGIAANVGFGFALSRLLVGSCVAFPDSNDQAIELLNYFGMDGLVGSPAQVTRLVGRIAAMSREVCSVRWVVLAGSRPSARDLDDVRLALGADIMVDYGATETGPAAVRRVTFPLVGEDASAAMTVLEQIDVSTDENVGQPGVGRIKIRAGGMGWPYAGGVVQTEADRGDGWFHPGDLGSFTADGRLVLHGRVDDVLNFGGVKFTAESVERTLRRHPAILDVAVGELARDGTFLPTVFVARLPGSDVATVKTWITEQLPHIANWKIVEVPSIPRTLTGKIVRRDLHASA